MQLESKDISSLPKILKKRTNHISPACFKAISMVKSFLSIHLSPHPCSPGSSLVLVMKNSSSSYQVASELTSPLPFVAFGSFVTLNKNHKQSLRISLTFSSRPQNCIRPITNLKLNSVPAVTIYSFVTKVKLSPSISGNPQVLMETCTVSGTGDLFQQNILSGLAP